MTPNGVQTFRNVCTSLWHEIMCQLCHHHLNMKSKTLKWFESWLKWLMSFERLGETLNVLKSATWIWCIIIIILIMIQGGSKTLCWHEKLNFLIFLQGHFLFGWRCSGLVQSAQQQYCGVQIVCFFFSAENRTLFRYANLLYVVPFPYSNV